MIGQQAKSRESLWGRTSTQNWKQALWRSSMWRNCPWFQNWDRSLNLNLIIPSATRSESSSVTSESPLKWSSCRKFVLEVHNVYTWDLANVWFSVQRLLRHRVQIWCYRAAGTYLFLSRGVSLTKMTLYTVEDRNPTSPTKVTLRVKMVA